MTKNKKFRKTDTKRKILSSFSMLLQHKEFSEISVSDIANHSGISRGTFYLHYFDKYDLRDQTIDEVVEDITKIFYSTSTTDFKNEVDFFPFDTVLKALEYCAKILPLLKVLIENDNRRYKDRLKTVLEERIDFSINTSNFFDNNLSGINSIYAKEIVLSSIVSIIFLWIRSGGNESPLEIAKIIEIAKSKSPFDIIRSSLNNTNLIQ